MDDEMSEVNESASSDKSSDNVFTLKQMVFDDTPNAREELADAELTLAYRELAHKALMVMGRPAPALTAIYDARSHLMTAMKHLIDPLNPGNAKSLNFMAAANVHLANAQNALDSETDNLTIDDAIVSVAAAIKTISNASSAMKAPIEAEPETAVYRRGRRRGRGR